MTTYDRTTVARSTGATVWTTSAELMGLDPCGGDCAWYNGCETHGAIVGHATLRLARSFASCPEEWCEDCRTSLDLGVLIPSQLPGGAVPSAFPPMLPCSTCGHRWPIHVLDNNNRCPICWDAKENPVTTTTRTTDNRWAAGSSGAVVPDDAPAAYGARWIDMGDSTPADVVPDRQGFAYTDRAAMTRLIDLLVDADKGIRSLAGLDRDAVEVTNVGTTWSIARRRAGGYVYVEAWLAS
jgi:hypothetical protein